MGNSLGYQIIDADNHYYETQDCFTRFADEKVRKHVRWVNEGKRVHLMFGDRLSKGVPNPTFNPIAKPGAFHDHLKMLEQGFRPSANGRTYGELEPLPREYQHRDERLMRMDEQDVETVVLFPTLGQCVEHYMYDDVDLMYGVFRAFNSWLDDEWGFNYKGRIYAPPVIPMLDVNRAVQELEWVLNRGAKIICLRPGPLYGRSPADPYFDPFWARINESGTFVGYHAIGGASPYDDAFRSMWVQHPIPDQQYIQTLREALFPGERPIMDTITALILGNFFGRFPNIKIGSIEMGCEWVEYLMHSLDHAGGFLDRHIEAFGARLDDRPSDVMKEHVYVSPFPEEDVLKLARLIGPDRVLMGSDWPHPEGNKLPIDYVECITSLPAHDIKRIMRDNTLELLSA
jgi:predicted TIM-barrel fold metal-dependent hydrolase